MIKISKDFIVDRKGKRKAVILSYKAYENLLEDLSDLAVVAERRKEKSVAHKDFLAELRRDGVI